MVLFTNNPAYQLGLGRGRSGPQKKTLRGSDNGISCESRKKFTTPSVGESIEVTLWRRLAAAQTLKLVTVLQKTSFTASGGTTSAFGRDTLGGGHHPPPYCWALRQRSCSSDHVGSCVYWEMKKKKRSSHFTRNNTHTTPHYAHFSS
ncbi:hypothetical protein Bbelb_313300 [Branchiostoma belcheri]|nr:hypothetical protein Bbelb_313300 [Branchiostoma belcheri]